MSFEPALPSALAAPRLRIYLNLGTLADSPNSTAFPSALIADAALRDARLAADGFEGVQLTHQQVATEPDSTLPYCGLDRVNTPAEADPVAARHAERGDRCLTLHVGWGMEDDDAVDALVRAVLEAAQRYRLPTFVETHRATITQDMWRTVRLTSRFPGLRFNIDLSHYYCGQEMVYGDWERKLAFLQPVFDRCGFIHGRIAAPGWMQAVIEPADATSGFAHGPSYLVHFREMWTRSMLGFLRHATRGSELIFAPELLGASNYYARKLTDADGLQREECDRYSQALLYIPVAQACWAEAQRRLASESTGT